MIPFSYMTGGKVWVSELCNCGRLIIITVILTLNPQLHQTHRFSMPYIKGMCFHHSVLSGELSTLSMSSPHEGRSQACVSTLRISLCLIVS